ncbi:ATP-binding protein [Candidatus Woesearchaeota archaeon]|nr:ATP-binding protein [Candidatus Woesearchaeota archaeon]
MIPKNILKEVILSQQDMLRVWDQGTIREEESEIHIEDSFALLITGVRRCGKSTLLNQLLKRQKKGYYLNIEDPRLEGFEPSDFLRVDTIMKELYGEGGTYFFDEIQNVKGWEKFVRYLVDKKEKVVITGSNASLLSRELGTKLTGRHLSIELFPFSFKEFLTYHKQKPTREQFNSYIKTGGFPEYIKKKNPSILYELLSDIVLKDIAVRFGIRNTHTLNTLAVYLLSNTGKEYSYNSIKEILHIKSVQSVINYISYFENAYLVFTVPLFHSSYKKQQVNPKKIYSIDTGLSSVNSASFSEDTGRILENAVFLELRRKHKEIFYFKNKNECDFIIKEKGKKNEAIQVCLEIHDDNREREIRGIIEAMTTCEIREGIIITKDQEDELTIEGKNIKIIPAWKWFQ